MSLFLFFRLKFPAAVMTCRAYVVSPLTIVEASHPPSELTTQVARLRGRAMPRMTCLCVCLGSSFLASSWLAFVPFGLVRSLTMQPCTLLYSFAFLAPTLCHSCRRGLHVPRLLPAEQKNRCPG